MVPTRLQLRNFLSYGESAPALDFEGLHVACLSGGNGQGKSALLDAMTWALWGEARKSADLRKPDEELLRVGARSMEVDFSFRAGGAEYRVVRSYAQSKSGKTSKPGLELQVRDGDGWQALTGGSVKETQAQIDERIGIDYETFINSTFLLQGRSDEFTKKKPSERKEILAKILALDRYDRMAQRAGRRWSSLREQCAALETEAERLVAALEHEAEWTADRDALDAHIGEVEAEHAAAAAAEAKVAERLAALDAAAREADALRAALADLDSRTAKVDAERADLDRKTAEADALIAQAETIEADHARYEVLRTQRTALDEKAGLYRGIESQLHALRLDLQKQTAALEAEITRGEAGLQTLAHGVREDERKLAGRPRAEAALATARAAVEEAKALEAVRQTRDAARRRIDAIDKQLAADRGALVGQHAAIVTEGKRLKADLNGAAPPDLAALDASVAEGGAARAKLEATRERGVELSATVQTLEARLETLAANRATLAARRERIATSQDEACPTCGTPLTDAHRADVAADYDREIAALDAQAAEARAGRTAAAEARDALRADFGQLKAAVEAGETAARARAAAADQAERRAAGEARLVELRAEAVHLGGVIEGEAFGAELRAERATHADVLDASPFDEARYDAVRRDAALADHWAAELRDLDQTAAHLRQTQADLAAKEKELAVLRERLDAGAHTRPTRQKVEALEAQAAALGYDAALHESVGRDLDRLAEAPRRLSALLEARRRRAEWAERSAALADERRSIGAEADAKRSALEALAARLADRAAAEAERGGAAARREHAARRLADARTRRGALSERLDRAARDRERLTATRKELREAKKERALYGHLKRAFGKHGIPSLIIEETLPEIEARANDLLERLSGGRTRVALETLKDKKTGGGTKETLDIKITDSQSVARSYETFSGGEAFRVNFALRIALSQMLAERAGTQIRTLVIDEGFGTQDAEGLQSLIGAIREIQDDFDTILVITHLDEIKAAFPVRIEVRKEPVTGSTFDVVGV
ncbi:SMC family ATPase [Rubrivirga sp. S365]|nr:SMC family ATPase [Rubrivirga sp. S365]MDT7857004.1 SMC family ATPase [Rubrivirga sp. S365]